MEQEIYCTPEEFQLKYGRGFLYPFGVIGKIIERKGKYYKEPDSSKSMILNKPFECFIGIAGLPFFRQDLLAIISDSDKPFVTKNSSSSKAWVEVDAPEPEPEPKTITRLMNADEVGALGAIWVDNGLYEGLLFGATLKLDMNGDMSFGGILISHCIYAHSSTATEWLPFTLTEAVK